MLTRSETDDPNIFTKIIIFSYSVSNGKELGGCAMRSHACLRYLYYGRNQVTSPPRRASDTTISIRSFKSVCPSLQFRVMQ